MPVKYRNLIRALKQDGWYLARKRGSHQVWKHPTKEGTIILAPHSLNGDVPPWLYNQVMREARL